MRSALRWALAVVLVATLPLRIIYEIAYLLVKDTAENLKERGL